MKLTQSVWRMVNVPVSRYERKQFYVTIYKIEIFLKCSIYMQIIATLKLKSPQHINIKMSNIKAWKLVNRFRRGELVGKTNKFRASCHLYLCRVLLYCFHD